MVGFTININFNWNSFPSSYSVYDNGSVFFRRFSTGVDFFPTNFFTTHLGASSSTSFTLDTDTYDSMLDDFNVEMFYISSTVSAYEPIGALLIPVNLFKDTYNYAKNNRNQNCTIAQPIMNVQGYTLIITFTINMYGPPTIPGDIELYYDERVQEIAKTFLDNGRDLRLRSKDKSFLQKFEDVFFAKHSTEGKSEAQVAIDSDLFTEDWLKQQYGDYRGPLSAELAKTENLPSKYGSEIAAPNPYKPASINDDIYSNLNNPKKVTIENPRLKYTPEEFLELRLKPLPDFKTMPIIDPRLSHLYQVQEGVQFNPTPDHFTNQLILKLVEYSNELLLSEDSQKMQEVIDRFANEPQPRELNVGFQEFQDSLTEVMYHTDYLAIVQDALQLLPQVTMQLLVLQIGIISKHYNDPKGTTEDDAKKLEKLAGTLVFGHAIFSSLTSNTDENGKPLSFKDKVFRSIRDVVKKLGKGDLSSVNTNIPLNQQQKRSPHSVFHQQIAIQYILEKLGVLTGAQKEFSISNETLGELTLRDFRMLGPDVMEHYTSELSKRIYINSDHLAHALLSLDGIDHEAAAQETLTVHNTYPVDQTDSFDDYLREQYQRVLAVELTANYNLKKGPFKPINAYLEQSKIDNSSLAYQYFTSLWPVKETKFTYTQRKVASAFDKMYEELGNEVQSKRMKDISELLSQATFPVEFPKVGAIGYTIAQLVQLGITAQQNIRLPRLNAQNIGVLGLKGAGLGVAGVAGYNALRLAYNKIIDVFDRSPFEQKQFNKNLAELVEDFSLSDQNLKKAFTRSLQFIGSTIWNGYNEYDKKFDEQNLKFDQQLSQRSDQLSLNQKLQDLMQIQADSGKSLKVQVDQVSDRLSRLTSFTQSQNKTMTDSLDAANNFTNTKLSKQSDQIDSLNVKFQQIEVAYTQIQLLIQSIKDKTSQSGVSSNLNQSIFKAEIEQALTTINNLQKRIDTLQADIQTNYQAQQEALVQNESKLTQYLFDMFQGRDSATSDFLSSQNTLDQKIQQNNAKLEMIQNRIEQLDLQKLSVTDFKTFLSQQMESQRQLNLESLNLARKEVNDKLDYSDKKQASFAKKFSGDLIDMSGKVDFSNLRLSAVETSLSILQETFNEYLKGSNLQQDPNPAIIQLDQEQVQEQEQFVGAEENPVQVEPEDAPMIVAQNDPPQDPDNEEDGSDDDNGGRGGGGGGDGGDGDPNDPDNEGGNGNAGMDQRQPNWLRKLLNSLLRLATTVSQNKVIKFLLNASKYVGPLVLSIEYVQYAVEETFQISFDEFRKNVMAHKYMFSHQLKLVFDLLDKARNVSQVTTAVAGVVGVAMLTWEWMLQRVDMFVGENQLPVFRLLGAGFVTAISSFQSIYNQINIGRGGVTNVGSLLAIAGLAYSALLGLHAFSENVGGYASEVSQDLRELGDQLKQIVQRHNVKGKVSQKLLSNSLGQTFGNLSKRTLNFFDKIASEVTSGLSKTASTIKRIGGLANAGSIADVVDSLKLGDIHRRMSGKRRVLKFSSKQIAKNEKVKMKKRKKRLVIK